MTSVIMLMAMAGLLSGENMTGKITSRLKKPKESDPDKIAAAAAKRARKNAKRADDFAMQGVGRR